LGGAQGCFTPYVRDFYPEFMLKGIIFVFFASLAGEMHRLSGILPAIGAGRYGLLCSIEGIASITV
jgi:hypothetical protein